MWISFSMCIFTFTDDGNIWVPLLLKKAWTRSSFHWPLAMCKGSCKISKALAPHILDLKGLNLRRVHRSHPDSHLIEKQHPSSVSPPQFWGAIYCTPETQKSQPFALSYAALVAADDCGGWASEYASSGRWVWCRWRNVWKGVILKCNVQLSLKKSQCISCDMRTKRCTSHDIGMLGAQFSVAYIKLCKLWAAPPWWCKKTESPPAAPLPNESYLDYLRWFIHAVCIGSCSCERTWAHATSKTFFWLARLGGEFQ